MLVGGGGRGELMALCALEQVISKCLDHITKKSHPQKREKQKRFFFSLIGWVCDSDGELKCSLRLPNVGERRRRGEKDQRGGGRRS